MKPILMICSLLLGLLLSAGAGAGAVEEGSVRFGKFGDVRLYHHSAQPRRVILWLSDAAGWDADSAAQARALAGNDTLVMGIDTRHYREHLEAQSKGCLYPAGDLEALSQFVQMTLALDHYVVPLLLGRGAGATLAYGTLVQAPANTFAAGIGMNFCPTDTLARPSCRGYGLNSTPMPGRHGYRLEPSKNLLSPWWVLSGTRSAACDTTLTKAFVASMPMAHWTSVNETGAREPDERAWFATLETTLAGLQAPAEESHSSTALADLPLVEVRPQADTSDTLIVIISGDGGWASIDRDLATGLSALGHSVVGLNSLEYFWKRRTPDSAAHDLQRLADYYLDAWHKQKIIFIGYSRGADVLPFMANRLSPDLLKRTRLVALLGAEMDVEFEFHVQDWLSSRSRHALPVPPEVEKLRGVPVLCIAGEDERDSLCRKLDPQLATARILKGGHHFGGDYTALSRIILDAAGEK
jgi:type IV secretory pathway VirJ component